MEKYYTLKEILLCVRKEQLKIESQLRKLEKMLDNYNNKRYQGSRFFSSYASEYKSLNYKLVINYTLQEKISNLLRGEFLNSKDVSTWLVKNEEGAYNLFDPDVNVRLDMQNDFNNLVREILTSEYLKNAVFSQVFRETGRKHNFMTTSSATSYNTCLPNGKDANGLSYYSYNDLVVCHFNFGDFGKTLEDVINKMLDVKIPAQDLPEYFVNLIEQERKNIKNIRVPSGKIYQKKQQFYLNEEQFVYELKRK